MPRAVKLMQVMSLVLVGVLPSGLLAQDETALRQVFEGQSVTLKLDMPGTSEGVNVYPARPTPLEFPKVANALKEHGTAIRTGESQMITKVRVKKNLIEVHLGGGGYGTFSDVAAGPSHVTAVEVGKTSRERQLENQLKTEQDKNRRKTLQRELDDLRAERARENARAQSDAMQANRAADAAERERRLQGGSRFNIRFDELVPAEYLTPEGVMRALDRYVTFAAADNAADEEPSVASLRKGMLLADVERILGPATDTTSAEVQGLKIQVRNYEKEGQLVRARFTSGVLVEYTIKSD